MDAALCALLLLALTAVTYAHQHQPIKRNFTIDYENNTFLKDGKPFRYVSGSIHYARITPDSWEDRLQKIYAAGLNAVQVYVPWNFHEPVEKQYRFEGKHDIVTFLKLAHKVGLYVVLRPGPYICAEWDFGGIPAWVIRKNSSIVLRSMDPGFIAPVDSWLSVLLPKIKPLLYANGGPVITVQVENEYGSYFTCDTNYMEYLKNAFIKHLSTSVVLFTTDGAGLKDLKCGSHKGLYATVDFGPGNATAGFKPQRVFEPKGPLVNSEFYTGWLDYWGGHHAHRDTTAVLRTLKDMLDMGANVNMYMFEGGTNYGYTNGADPTFQVCPTSYDYDAPLSEAGDITNKYQALRNLLLKYNLHEKVEVPKNSTKKAYGKVTFQRIGSAVSLLQLITTRAVIHKPYPLSMEELLQNDGFVLYQSVLASDVSNANLDISGVRDRGYVMMDSNYIGTVDRNGVTNLTINAKKGQTLSILVENQGHINYGSQINQNRKGLTKNVTVNGSMLMNWQMVGLNLTRLVQSATMLSAGNRAIPNDDFQGPALYLARMKTPFKSMYDTYFNPMSLSKGQFFINGFNLGRYWPTRGPQVTMYVPASVWDTRLDYQDLWVLELELEGVLKQKISSVDASFQDFPVLNSKTGVTH